MPDLTAATTRPYQTTLLAQRIEASAGPDGQEACRKVALGNGFTREKAEDCDDGSVGCPNCPWLRSRNTTFEALRPGATFVVLYGPQAGRTMTKERMDGTDVFMGVERRRGGAHHLRPADGVREIRGN